MSRKRIVAALLLLVTFALGTTAYLLTRSTPNTEAITDADLASAEASATDYVDSGVDIPSTTDAVLAASTKGPPPAPPLTHGGSASEDADATDDLSDEDSTVMVNSVDMPTSSIVLASATESGSESVGSSLRYRSVGFGGGSARSTSGGSGTAGGGSGSPGGGSGVPQDSSPSGSPGSESAGSAEPEGNVNPAAGKPSPETLPPGNLLTPPEDTHDPDPVYYPDDEKDTTPGQETVNVPEPSMLALLGVGGLAAFALGWRRKRQQAL